MYLPVSLVNTQRFHLLCGYCLGSGCPGAEPEAGIWCTVFIMGVFSRKNYKEVDLGRTGEQGCDSHSQRRALEHKLHPSLVFYLGTGASLLYFPLQPVISVG